MAEKIAECEPIFDDKVKKEEWLKENATGRVSFSYGVMNCVNYVPSGDSGSGYCVAAEMRCNIAQHFISNQEKKPVSQQAKT